MNKKAPLEELAAYCTQIRRHLHQFPELSFREEKTAEYILERLAELGIEGRRIGRTGVCAVIEAAAPGSTVLVRADTDALPIQEENEVPYASVVPGVMHACGHDGHTAILLGLALILKKNIDNFHGKAVLLFQPAEESPPGGAVAMIEGGILNGVDTVFGCHISTELPVGKIGVHAGPFAASVDQFAVQIDGKGGHGATPHLCIDPIVIGSQLVSNWQSIISRRKDPLAPAVLTVGVFQGGTSFNVIPNSVRLAGTVRTLSETVREQIENDFKTMTKQVCEGYGAKASIDYKRGYPVLVNDAGLTGLITEKCKALWGADAVLEMKETMTSEDFAYYGKICPSAYFVIGGANPAQGLIYANHHPRFDFDERALAIGVEVLWNLFK